MTTLAISPLRGVILGWLLASAAGGYHPAAAASNRTLEFLERRVASDPLDHVAQNRLALQYMEVMRSSGELAHLQRAQRAAMASLAAVPMQRNPAGASALAAVRYESHRFREALALARQTLQVDPRNLLAAVTAADAEFELGDYDAADRSYAALRGVMPKAAWHLRRSRVAEIRGQEPRGLALLLELAGTADDCAALRVRLSEWYFARGDFTQARLHLDAAAGFEPASAVVQEHAAELLAAQGEHAQAVAAYQRLIERVPRPEYMQALGDLHAFVGAAEAARHWHERALQGYLRASEAGNAHYFHHLASFHSDSQPDAAQALRWARRDLEIRNSIYAYEALAWALYKNGEYPQAAAAMERALRHGTRKAHLLHHAAMIYTSAGRVRQGSALMQQAMTMNPCYQTFHVHR